MKNLTPEQIRQASKENPGVESTLRTLFPEAFVVEWVDITKQVYVFFHNHGNGYDIHFALKRETEQDWFGWMWGDGRTEIGNGYSPGDFKIEKVEGEWSGSNIKLKIMRRVLGTG